MVKKGRKSSPARRKAKKPGSSRAPRAVGRAQPALRHEAAAQLENAAGAAVGLPHPTARARFAATTAEQAKLEHSVELERTERMAAYDAAIQKAVEVEGLEGPAASLRILAEGDSWFDYPLGSDVIDQLRDLLGVPIANMAHHGAEVRQMLNLKQRNEIDKRLASGAPDGRPWDAMLFSGGGNDIVGDELCIWLKQFRQGMTARDVLDAPRFEAVLQIVTAGYADLISIRDQRSADTSLFFHTYDLASPTGRGVCNVGPWLKPSLDFRQVPPEMQAEVVKLLLQRFSELIRPLANPLKKVFVVDTQGTFPPQTTPAQIKVWWANELHPTNRGFRAIARKLAVALKDQFPQLAPIPPESTSHAAVGSAAATPAARPHVNRFRSQLAQGGFAAGGLESAAAAAPALDLSPARVDERMSALEQEWRQVVSTHLDDAPELHDLVREIAGNGREALRVVGDQDENRLAGDSRLRGQVEVIVQMDGSRPSFMIRSGAVDLSTSPVGTWGGTLRASSELLRDAIACVGRIDVPGSSQGFGGTGFLVAEDLIVTNRHVLQAIATPQGRGKWRFNGDISIDFGHEFRATQSLNRRGLERLVFAGRKEIDPFRIDHGRLDLVLIELEPARPAQKLQRYLAVDAAQDWASSQQTVYIIGYPGRPRVQDETPTLLEKLFKQTFGCKRLAPGFVTVTPDLLPESPRDWSTGHDATTLGGNSGSAVLIVGREQAVAGLHYGGTRSDPRVNWAHVLGRALDETDGFSNKTLRKHLRDRDVQLVDILGGA